MTWCFQVFLSWARSPVFWLPSLSLSVTMKLYPRLPFPKDSLILMLICVIWCMREPSTALAVRFPKKWKNGSIKSCPSSRKRDLQITSSLSGMRWRAQGNLWTNVWLLCFITMRCAAWWITCWTSLPSIPSPTIFPSRCLSMMPRKASPTSA